MMNSEAYSFDETLKVGYKINIRTLHLKPSDDIDE